MEESIAIEGFAKDDSGGHDLVGEFRTIQAIAMAGTKLSPRLKARGILRRSLRLQRCQMSTDIPGLFVADSWSVAPVSCSLVFHAATNLVTPLAQLLLPDFEGIPK